MIGRRIFRHHDVGATDRKGSFVFQRHMDNKYLKKAKREIEQWESQSPGFLTHLNDFMLLPAENAAKALIPAGLQHAVAKTIQNLLSGLSSATRLISNEEKIYYKVEAAYKKYGDQLKAADVVAKRYWNRNLAYAIGEGGATGAIGLVGLAADVPALLTVSLRLIRQIGICYARAAGPTGCAGDMKSNEEQEYVMHILGIGSTSNLKAKMEFLVGLRQIEHILLKVSWQEISEAVARREISRLSLLGAMRQFAQRLGIQLTKRKALQMVPVIGALIGASFNALFVNDIGRAAYMVYRRRRIAELEGPSTTTLELSAEC